MTDWDVLARSELIARDLLNPENDPNVGSARGDNQSKTTGSLENIGVTGSTSGTALLSTFLPAFILAVLGFALFLVCRHSQRRFYAPRSHLGHLHNDERSPELPSGFLNWIGKFLQLPDSHVLRHSSLDGYFFLRFLKKMSVVSVVGCLITWPILLPIHATGSGGNQQLDLLNFSNVVNPNWYYAHTLAAWMFFGFVFYMVTRESIFYATLRQAYLMSPLYASRISSRTVLFMAVPHSYRNKPKLLKIFGDSVQKIWISSDCSELKKLVDERDKLAFRLEEMETRYIKAAHKAQLKAIKKAGLDPEAELEAASTPQGNDENPNLAPWLLKVKRPAHRLKYFVGDKVDTIDWLRSRLATIIPEVHALQKKHREGDVKPHSAVFIEFQTQTDAQIAFQTLSHHHPFQMTPRYIGIPPNQVIWPALHYSWWQRIIRKFLMKGFITILIVFWSIPSAFIGTISNITYLSKLLPFLKFIDTLPTFVKGIISGLLPAAGLALLMAAVPAILRWCARISGVPSGARVELFTQNAHFCFQVVQVFLITTLTSAASAGLTQIIQDPLSAKDLLAKNLPKATNFYVSYFLFQGLILSSGAVVQVITYFAFKVFRMILDTTPRKMYARWASLNGICWGTVFPVFTNMAVIAITYSCIAPLVLGFAAIGLYLVYQAYRYNLLFVYDPEVDTKGLVYPRALQQVLTGIYLAEVCMIGLFALRGAIGPVILMAMLTVVTILAHISLNDALAPLLNALPRTLNNDEEWMSNVSTVKSETTTATNHLPSEKDDKYFRPRRQSSLTLTEITSSRNSFREKLKIITDWLIHPSIYANYAALQRKIRQDPGVTYDEYISENAYYPPPVSSPVPLLWVPRDAGGISRQEVELTKKVIPITDEEAHLNKKNKVVWDEVGMKPPIWEEKVFY